jgi:restriction endonuclease Mrr
MLLGAVAQRLHGATRGVFVTTAQFSASAREMASQHGIELIDGARLTVMFGQCGQSLTTGSKRERRKLAG